MCSKAHTRDRCWMYRVVPSYFQCWKVRKSLLLMEWRILRFQLYGQTTKRRDVPSPSSSLPTHFSSTAILRVPSRGVIATRVEPPPASSPIPCPTIFQYETKRKEIETFLASPERKSYLLSVDILYTYFSYVEKFTRQNRPKIVACFRSRFY